MPLNYKRLYMDSPEMSTPKAGDAGYDLRAYGDYSLRYNRPTSIDTGIAVEIPPGFVGLILPRSGLRFNENINTFGTGVIDSSYRGELKVLLTNLRTTHYPFESPPPYEIHHGDKIAQLVIVPVFTEEVQEVNDLSDTDRGAKGFGSSGRQ